MTSPAATDPAFSSSTSSRSESTLVKVWIASSHLVVVFHSG